MLPFADPALPLDEAGKYVAGAYVVFLVLIVVYVAIMASKLQRIERELRELASFAEQGKQPTPEAVRTNDKVAAQGPQGGQGVGASATAPGREAEEAVVDSNPPSADSDHDLIPSEAAEGPVERVQGAPDV